MALEPLGDIVGALVRLKSTLMLRGLQRSRSALAGALIGLLLFLPFALGFGGGLGYLVATLHGPVIEHLIRFALLVIGAIWTLSPIFGFQLNETYDITRLFVYPVAARRIFVAVVAGSLFDLSSLFALPTLLGVIGGAAWHGVWAGLVALLVVPLYLVQTLALSQGVVLLLQGVLQSRRFRDIALVVVPLFWFSYQIFWQMFSRRASQLDWAMFVRGPVWEGLGFLPGGLAGRAIGAALHGDFGLVLAYTSGLALVALLTVFGAGRLVEKVFGGEEVGVPTPAPTSTAPVPRRLRKSGLARWPLLDTMVGKELTYYTRDPYFRVLAMNLVYLLVFAAFFAFTRGQRTSNAAVSLWWMSGLVLLQQAPLLYNLFGTEGSAAAWLFATPVPRRQLLLAKNLAVLLPLLLLNALVVLLGTVVLHQTALLPVFLPWVLLAPVLMAAVGNGISVWFPTRVQMRSFRARQQASGQGPAYGFLMLGIFLGALPLFRPVLAAVLVPWLWAGLGWLALTVPCAALYAVGLLALSLKLTEPWLLERESEIVAKVARPDS